MATRADHEHMLPAGFADFQDFREAARRRLPDFIFAYLDGGIGRDANLKRNRSSLDDVRIEPRINDAPPNVDLSCDLFGHTYDLPVGVAPLGMTSMMHHDSATSLARRAAALNMPMALSLVAGHAMEDVKAASGRAAWQQLYWPDEQEMKASLIERMKRAGVTVAMPTVDIPGWQWRESWVRMGVSTGPNTLQRLKTLAMRPGWTLDVLRRGGPDMPNLSEIAPGGAAAGEAFLLKHTMRPLGPREIAEFRDLWDGALVVKGVMAPEDAEIFAGIGVDGIVVSNHGGRQLDAAPGTAEMLPDIASAVAGRMKVIADGGVWNGLDALRLLRLGADAVMVGRLPYFATAGLGESGAAVLDMLSIQVRAQMVQLGVRNLAELRALRLFGG